MRGALIGLGAAVAVALAWWVLRPAADGLDALAAQSADAGGVEVTVTPMQLDDDTARFEVAFDTHTVDLTVNAEDTVLLVGSVRWGPPRWDGDPAGGHHRSGRLSFPAQGPAVGPAVLSIGGLPAPVSFEWNLGQP
jgi:hypothetical protein